MRIKTVEKDIIDFGVHQWKIATIIVLWWNIASEARTLEKIVNMWEKLVVFKWDILNNPDSVSIISQINLAGYTAIVNTDAWDEIAPLMRYKNVSVSMFIDIPKDWVESVFNANNLTYLRERDEIRFSVNTIKDYEDFCNFSKVKNIHIPYKVLEIQAENYERMKDYILKGTLSYNTILKLV